MELQTMILKAKEQFDSWRANKHNGERIPEALWAIVKQILLNSPKKSLMRQLGVSKEQLKRKFPEHFSSKTKFSEVPSDKQQSISRQIKPAANKTFVQASLNNMVTMTSSEIIIERQNGTKLNIRMPTQEQFTTLIKTFME